MRVKKRIHPLDLCVILLIILCLLGLFLRWKDLSARDTDGAVRYEIVMEMPGVRWETAACYVIPSSSNPLPAIRLPAFNLKPGENEVKLFLGISAF